MSLHESEQPPLTAFRLGNATVGNALRGVPSVSGGRRGGVPDSAARLSPHGTRQPREAGSECRPRVYALSVTLRMRDDRDGGKGDRGRRSQFPSFSHYPLHSPSRLLYFVKIVGSADLTEDTRVTTCTGRTPDLGSHCYRKAGLE